MAAPEALVTRPLQKLFKGQKGGGSGSGSGRRKGGEHDSDVEDAEGSQALLPGRYSSSAPLAGPGSGGSGSGGRGGGGARPGLPPESP